MGSIVGLVMAAAAPMQLDEFAAQNLIGEARERQLDILVYLIHRLGLPEADIYARAASFLDLPFSPAIPAEPEGIVSKPQARKVPDLGVTQILASQVFDRLVVFVAPSAEEMIALAARRRMDPNSLRDICIVPPRALRATLCARSQEDLLENARQRLAKRWPVSSAHLELPLATRFGFVLIVALFIIVVAFAPFNLASWSVGLLLLVFIPNAWFRLAAIFETPDMVRARESTLLKDNELPDYTILIPLRDEAGMVPQLVRAMTALDYPPEKLDIKFIVESVSAQTIDAVRAHLSNPCFELIIVPEAPPHTKPKALNFAMPMARGACVVVYDAEDIPEPSQLRRAATAFANNPGTDCLQAELRVENPGDSWLSALFAAEYSGLFGVMLPALARWRFPLPLGGTSNHFRIEALKAAGGWDAFNVTEDADLGVRLSRLRYRVQTLPSITLEEAPISLKAWLAQRTRWMKGWMQTFIVHNRHPILFFRDMGWRNFVAFQLFVGGMVLSAPLHLVFLLALIARIALDGQQGIGIEGGVGFAHLFLLVAGYIGSASHMIIGAARLNRRGLMTYQLLLPIYWALIGVAAFRAGYELITRPFFWAKTQHGLTKKQSI